jgi:hypothetical protein
MDDETRSLRRVLVPDQTVGTSTVWEPGIVAVRPAPRVQPIDPALDATLIGILGEPPRPAETIAAAYQRKEVSLREVFARLDVPASRAMHARLALPRPDDQLAEQFGRLTAERRGRLRDFLADVRRRQAIGMRRR